MSARTIANKVIIITGASSGIGRAVALALAPERARLVLVARRQPLLESLAEEVRMKGGSALVMTLDLRDKSHVEIMIASAREQYGRIDVLINNAGFGYLGTVEETPPSVVREIFALNFEAPLLASQLVIPIMKAQGGGHIINVSSVVGRRGLPLNGIYCATKFALQGISESLRLEVKDAGIDVTIVSPAATESEFGDNVRRGRVKAKFKPSGLVQSAEEVARSIVECIRRPKLEVYPSRTGRLLAWASALSPAVVDRILANYYKDRFRVVRGE
jgi:short-subunit dehydrogenase